MAAEILLEINGHKYNASGFSYDFYQVPDFKGKSVTGIKGGDIHVVLDSSYDNTILETMLSNKTRKVSCVPWEEYEPCPVSGRIQFVQDDVHVFRELAFEEAYITRYKEKMDANGYPMSILLTISTLRLDINKFVRMDRRSETTYGFGWVKFKEKELPKIIVKPEDDLSTKITDAYWIDENNTMQKDSFPDFPFTLYVKVDTTIVGKQIDLNFKFEDPGAYKCAKYSGIINGDGIIVIENFKFETEQHEEN